MTLDDIEHQILRRELKEPRIHFAINCASVSCPPLPPEPYRAETLDAQLDEAARRYLASPEGLRVDGDTLRVSRILDWYGEDFVERFASLAPEGRDENERAVRGVVIRFGPPEAAALARKPSARIRFLELRLVAQRRALGRRVHLNEDQIAGATSGWQGGDAENQGEFEEGATPPAGCPKLR